MSIDTSLPSVSLAPVDTTKKLPPDPNPLASRATHQYPMIKGQTDANGKTIFESQFGDSLAHFSAELGFDGRYEVLENGEKKVKHVLENSIGYHYGSKGQSHHFDGHHDHATQGNYNRNSQLDSSTKTGADSTEGAGGTIQKGSHGGSFTNDSGGTKFETTSGDHVKQHDGHIHTNIKGDAVDAVVGNKYTITQKDYGIHVQGGGNMDFKIDGGQYQIQSGKDVTIKSATKITLQVGGSSIVITPNDITIISGGTVNIKGSGDIITKGQTTKLQNGDQPVLTEAGASGVVFAKV